ncbi:hypothetical protein [Pseudosulfitobacter pseudonitzschiae]|uniref:hypothetical protein n=1 Tax=Pseudosulfitobacter pseudonitzschiae TaxID=1402135 RepID=UPI003B7E7D62
MNAAPEPVATMGARYRILSEGDIIHPDDEGLRPDCERWTRVTENAMVCGLRYAPGLHAPMRRPLGHVFPPLTLEEYSEAQLRDLLTQALSFRVDSEITIVHRGATGWAVSKGSATVNTDLEAEYEPMPSSRSEEYIARTRFPLEMAFDIARKYIANEKAKGYYRGT